MHAYFCGVISIGENSRNAAVLASDLVRSSHTHRLSAPMLSVLRTPIRHLHTTISLFALLALGLLGLVVQRLSASELKAPEPSVVTVATTNAPRAPRELRARTMPVGPKGRSLPWVRWEYIP